MPRSIVVALLGALLASAGCGAAPPPPGPADPVPAPEPAPVATRPPTAQDPPPPSAEAPPEPDPIEPATVEIVVLGTFDDRLLDAIEAKLVDELGVVVHRSEPIPLPKEAYHAPRRRYRADRLLDRLDEAGRGDPSRHKVLGVTDVDISTTKGEHADWGVFGLGALDGRSCVISSYRLRRRATPQLLASRVATTALHEIGHTFGLPHCTEPRCPMQDAQGGIANTDSSSGHLGPTCRDQIDRALEPPA